MASVRHTRSAPHNTFTLCLHHGQRAPHPQHPTQHITPYLHHGQRAPHARAEVALSALVATPQLKPGRHKACVHVQSVFYNAQHMGNAA
eukprot:355730-Chlamydomonas_euryale.AAC.2